MTIYQQTAPPIVWDVESPLDEYYEEETIRIGYADLPPVATDPIQQRMIGILLFVTVAVVGFAILVLPNLLRNSGEETAVIRRLRRECRRQHHHQPNRHTHRISQRRTSSWWHHLTSLLTRGATLGTSNQQMGRGLQSRPKYRSYHHAN